MLQPKTVQCPYCWEEVEITVDASAGRDQQYVEDCSVCCRPWNVRVTISGESDNAIVTVEPAS